MKKRKLCMIFLLCLALMTLVAGCRSKKETNDQGNQKGTAIYYTNNDVTKLIMKKENVELEGNQQQKVKILLKKLQQTPKSDKDTLSDSKENYDQCCISEYKYR